MAGPYGSKVIGPIVALLCGAGALAMWRAPPDPPERGSPPVSVHAADYDRRIHFDEPLPRLTLPDRDVELVRSILRVDAPMRHGQFVWDERAAPTGPLWVRVDLSRQMISVFRNGHEIGTAVVLFGTDAGPTPPGVYPILAKMRDHRSSLYDAEMPFTLRLTGDGIAIHASAVRRGSATHGCIGVPAPFARRLFEAARVGDRVVIQARA